MHKNNWKRKINFFSNTFFYDYEHFLKFSMILIKKSWVYENGFKGGEMSAYRYLDKRDGAEISIYPM